jgi:hypothetical protein
MLSKSRLFFISLINKLKILLEYSLLIIKYLLLVFIGGFFVYEIKFKPIKVENDKTLSIFEASYMYIDNIPLLKAYIYKYSNDNLKIHIIKRKPLFIMNYKCYDQEGFPIKETFNLENFKLINVTGDSHDFLQIYKIISPYIKDEEIFSLQYLFFRWNIIIRIDEYSYLIKLPVEITEKTQKRINYIFKNRSIIFNKSNKIIDLRFHKNIYIAK